ncbi:phage tail tube protein [Streptomyces sp. NPDC004752]
MPLLDEAAIVPGTGFIYLADPDTAKPTAITDPLNPGPGWINIGHTSRDDLPEFGRDGDGTETIGSWRSVKLRQTSPDVTYLVTFQFVQASTDTYKLYFGTGDEAAVPSASPPAQSRRSAPCCS